MKDKMALNGSELVMNGSCGGLEAATVPVSLIH